MTDNLRPAKPVHPVDVVCEEILARNWHIREVAERAGTDVLTIAQVLLETHPITPDIAAGLARAFGTSAKLWLGLQRDWDAWQKEALKGTRGRLASASRSRKREEQSG
jgi:addiction module HigA family antidote